MRVCTRTAGLRHWATPRSCWARTILRVSAFTQAPARMRGTSESKETPMKDPGQTEGEQK